MEEFLRLGKIGQQKNIPKGVTLPRWATLQYKGAQHDAVIQTVNIAKTSFQSTKGTELNFKDFWGYNVAGYELAKILELNMVPPYVERKVGVQEASLSWLVNDSMMELDRKNWHMEPPDLDSWNKQMYAVRVWHQLIYDTDHNLTNLMITKGDTQRQVIYNSGTKWMQGAQASNKPSSIDELKENWYINCKGAYDGVKLVASACRFRESK